MNIFEKILAWFRNRQTKKFEAFLEKREKEKKEKDQLDENERNRLKALELDEKRNSSEPWISIESAHYSEEENGIELNIEWNPAFITHLKNAGFKGSDENELIEKYLRVVSNNLIDGEDIKNMLQG